MPFRRKAEGLDVRKGREDVLPTVRPDDPQHWEGRAVSLKGYYVVDWVDEKWKRISPIYSASSAAERFRELAVRTGRRHATVTNNVEPRGVKQKLPKRPPDQPPEGYPF